MWRRVMVDGEGFEMVHRLIRKSDTWKRLIGCVVCSALSVPSTVWASEPAPATTSADVSATSAPSEDELATARLHFANGVELIQSSPPNYQDAYRQFQLASEKSHGSWTVLGNLGLCALKLERDGEALEYYQSYLKSGGEEIDAGERDHIERELLLIKGNMTTVSITSSEPRLRLRVSRQGSSAPPQVYEPATKDIQLGLRSGTLTIVATAANGETLSWEATVAAGEGATHHFDFDAQPQPTPVAADQASDISLDDASGRPMSTLRLSGIVTAGVGVAALGGGLAVGLISQSAEKKAKDECILDICPESTEAKLDSAKTKATVANILLISGGVLAVTGVTLIVLGGPSQKNHEVARAPVGQNNTFSLQITPLAQPSGGGLLAWGQF